MPRSAHAGENSSDAKRIVTFDWGLTATALDLGANVVGLPSIEYYNLTTVEPPLPADVVDVGLLFTPNFEFLDELAPDAIVIPPALSYTAPLLERIAPTFAIDINGTGEDVLAAARKGTGRLAEKLGLAAAADDLYRSCEATLDRARDRAEAWHNRPFYIASFADDRHLTTFGRGSLFHDVLGRLSLRNALGNRTMFGGRVVIGMEELAAFPDAAILLLSGGGNNSVPTGSAAGIFWRSLPAVRRGHVFELPAILEDGGLPSASRFARLAGNALATRAPADG
ncbi:MAG: ABC transporter substrate-binding protein [Rhizobiaceae bacterium]|nr:ABC transporter substrate-binding protein [Rhizobiaceae bacterium]